MVNILGLVHLVSKLIWERGRTKSKGFKLIRLSGPAKSPGTLIYTFQSGLNNNLDGESKFCKGYRGFEEQAGSAVPRRVASD